MKYTSINDTLFVEIHFQINHKNCYGSYFLFSGLRSEAIGNDEK